MLCSKCHEKLTKGLGIIDSALEHQRRLRDVMFDDLSDKGILPAYVKKEEVGPEHLWELIKDRIV